MALKQREQPPRLLYRSHLYRSEKVWGVSRFYKHRYGYSHCPTKRQSLIQLKSFFRKIPWIQESCVCPSGPRSGVFFIKAIHSIWQQLDISVFSDFFSFPSPRPIACVVYCFTFSSPLNLSPVHPKICFLPVLSFKTPNTCKTEAEWIKQTVCHSIATLFNSPTDRFTQ